LKSVTGRRDIQFVLIRVLAVAFGLVCLAILILGTLGGALVILALVGIVHAVRRRMGKPMTLFASWATAVTVAAVLTTGAMAWAFSQRDTTGTTVWHRTVTTVEQADQHPPPPPRFLRYLPGAVPPPPTPKALRGPLMVWGFVLGAGFVAVIVGSMIWGAAWVVASGWTGRFAGIGVVDESRALA
jgi:hypothetical protein